MRNREGSEVRMYRVRWDRVLCDRKSRKSRIWRICGYGRNQEGGQAMATQSDHDLLAIDFLRMDWRKKSHTCVKPVP